MRKKSNFMRDDIKSSLASFARVSLVHLPTPMRKLERVTAELGGPEICIKSDDLTGLAFGGNKSRKLELIVADALAKEANVVVTWGALQSNWAMQTAAACAKYDLPAVLVLFKTYDLPPESDGNVLLERILKADIRFKEAVKGKLVTQEIAVAAGEEVAAEYREAGKKPYIVSCGGSLPMGGMDRPLGAIAYVQAFLEMLEQAEEHDFRPDAVVHASGSGGTQAGLLCGAKWTSPETRVIGISVSDPKEPFTALVRTIAEAAERTMGFEPAIKPEDYIVLDDYLQDGYGIINKDVAGALRHLFRTEGIILDPVYTVKAFIGMLDLIRKGHFKKTDKIVFFHTGGTPALFPNKHNLLELLD
ncbi:MAG: D-cysteine desulfhydrase family protein [Candidatus Aminicenantales bacterium]